MSADIKIVRANAEHALDLARNMRAEDRAEVLASGGYTPYAALEESMVMSGPEAWAAIKNDRVMAMFGLVPMCLATKAACPWLLTSDLVDEYPKEFYRTAKLILHGLFLTRYSHLTNMVDARYKKACRWLERMGFRLVSVAYIGPDRTPFFKYEIGG